MGQYRLTTSSLSAATWRATQPEIPAPGALLSADSITDSYAQRLVARAKRRWELAMNALIPAPTISDEKSYIATACQPGGLQGFCFVAADEIARDLSTRGANTQCVHVAPIGGGADHYFTVVNKGSTMDSLIVDATWLLFALEGFPFCLAGTLKTVTTSLKSQPLTIDLVDAYEAGLEVIRKWAAYSCFQ